MDTIDKVRAIRKRVSDIRSEVACQSSVRGSSAQVDRLWDEFYQLKMEFEKILSETEKKMELGFFVSPIDFHGGSRI